jgi:hypothetical protein
MSLLWKIGGAAVALLAAYFLVTMYGKARYQTGQSDERTVWQAKVIEAEKGKLAAFQQGLAQRDAASTVYRETIRTLPPITNTIIDRTASYATTPAGAVQCLPADRVLGIEQTRIALFPTAASTAPAGITEALPAGPAGAQP